MNIGITELLFILGPLTFISWPLLSLATLVALRRRQMMAMPQALWALIILVIPVLGSAAFWLVRPGEDG
ncbi:MAG: hypothetical protein CL608_03065 [Anaerolineaceae bacterium]|nr:hypothetical protein [Anaerolineaceae bacterium]